MDYKDKYIKYKIKYLELKNMDVNNQIGGGKDNIRLAEKLNYYTFWNNKYEYIDI